MRISSSFVTKNWQLSTFTPSTAIGACCLAGFMLGLAGCASKPNPLIDDPSQADYVTQGVSKVSAPPPAPVRPAPAASTPTTAPASASSTASNTGGAQTAGGVQTTGAPKTWLQSLLYRFTPFRVTIQQGNFISQEMVSQLKVGMTHEQVRFILGTPLVADVFHKDRWDYPFRLQKGNGEVTTSKVTVFFKNERVESISGKELPTEQDYINQLAGPVKTAGKKPEASKTPATAKPAEPAK
jgi:outer membrane protein assembly factor BamE